MVGWLHPRKRVCCAGPDLSLRGSALDARRRNSTRCELFSNCPHAMMALRANATQVWLPCSQRPQRDAQGATLRVPASFDSFRWGPTSLQTGMGHRLGAMRGPGMPASARVIARGGVTIRNHVGSAWASRQGELCLATCSLATIDHAPRCHRRGYRLAARRGIRQALFDRRIRYRPGRVRNERPSRPHPRVTATGCAQGFA